MIHRTASCGSVLAGAASAALPVSAGMPIGPWGARADQASRGFHRDLIATALALRPLDGPTDSTLMVISVDVVVWPHEVGPALRARVAERLGVPIGAVLVCATHTHSSLPLDDANLALWDDGRGAEARRQLVELTLPDLATRAAAALAPARMMAIRRPCAVARSRRQTAFGRQLVGVSAPVQDAFLDCLDVVADDGRAIATVVVYGCHPTTFGPANWQYSPDYAAGIRDVVGLETGGSVLFLQGCGADRAPVFGFSDSARDVEQVGRTLGHIACGSLLEERQAGYAVHALGVLESGAPLCLTRAAAPATAPADFQIAEREIALPLRPRDLPAAERRVHDCERELRESPDQRRATALARAVIELDICRRFPCDRAELMVSALRVGPLVLLGWPGELAGFYETAFQNACPQAFVVSATNVNDYTSYLPAAAQFDEGGYEVDASPFAKPAAAAAVDAVGGLLAELMPA